MTITFPFDHLNMPYRPMRETPKRPRKPIKRLPTVVADGGRATAGLPMQGKHGDCVTRAISIAACLPYAEVWQAMKPFAAKGNPDKGVFTHREGFGAYMRSLGFVHTSCLSPKGRAGRVKLRQGDLPMGRLVVHTKRHAQAVINGVVHDIASTATPSVRGYWTLREPPQD